MAGNLRLLLSLGSLACGALAHSHIAYVVINGLQFHGFTPRQGFEQRADQVGWSTSAYDDGHVRPDRFSSNDIICHRDGAADTPNHVPVNVSDEIRIQWNGWPQSHAGPALSYLARCPNTGCHKVDKTKLKFFKIDETGLFVPNIKQPPVGRWASDTLIVNNNSWAFRLPPRLKPGPYVLRSELIALHFANETDEHGPGVQHYPQCLNLYVEGPGTQTYENRAGDVRTFYKPTDPSASFDLYRPFKNYTIPGPALIPDPGTCNQTQETQPTAWGVPVKFVGTKVVKVIVPLSTSKPSALAQVAGRAVPREDRHIDGARGEAADIRAKRRTRRQPEIPERRMS